MLLDLWRWVAVDAVDAVVVVAYTSRISRIVPNGQLEPLHLAGLDIAHYAVRACGASHRERYQTSVDEKLRG